MALNCFCCAFVQGYQQPARARAGPDARRGAHVVPGHFFLLVPWLHPPTSRAWGKMQKRNSNTKVWGLHHLEKPEMNFEARW